MEELMYRQAVNQLSGDEMEVFVAGLCEMGERLEQFNQGRMEQITLSEENQAFLDGAFQIRDQGITGDSAFQLLVMLSAL